jgi:KDEL-tailed cysteine endopeptidase
MTTKTVFVALALVGTLTAGYFIYNNQPSKTPDVPSPVKNDTKIPVKNDTESALKNIYNQWKLTYKINVGAAEDDYRFKVFSTNYAKITQHNNKSGKSYKLGLNAFTHLTQEEFAATRLGFKAPKNLRRNTTSLPLKNLKASVDWRSQLNAIKDQGQCGSCWAFSAVGALEGVHSIKKGNLYNLAEQELVDCSSSYGNMGCSGGLMDYAFQYVIDNKGLNAQTDYPYTAVDGDCQPVTARNAQVSSFVDVTPNSAAALKAAINQHPISVAIEADTFTFQAYTSGVINDDSCGTNLDHGVVAVGYDDAANPPYYIVRNSWGASWGDAGHVKIGIQDGAGICGIQQMSSYPVL